MAFFVQVSDANGKILAKAEGNIADRGIMIAKALADAGNQILGGGPGFSIDDVQPPLAVVWGDSDASVPFATRGG